MEGMEAGLVIVPNSPMEAKGAGPVIVELNGDCTSPKAEVAKGKVLLISAATWSGAITKDDGTLPKGFWPASRVPTTLRSVKLRWWGPGEEGCRAPKLLLKLLPFPGAKLLSFNIELGRCLVPNLLQLPEVVRRRSGTMNEALLAVRAERSA
mmetsp:Transcript_124591/g.346976  ORF Transcript_124591/g.346976 Transcript_124591/m.346976 type:complete len:152 (-) Transcript_124591:7-462(-)